MGWTFVRPGPPITRDRHPLAGLAVGQKQQTTLNVDVLPVEVQDFP
jgi:hypothetical protein